MAIAHSDREIGRRREHRIAASLQGMLISNAEAQLARIDSLSCRGAGVSFETLVQAGEKVILTWNHHSWDSIIMWSYGRRCGLKFRNEIPYSVVAEVRQMLTEDTPLYGRYSKENSRRSRAGPG